MKCFDSILEQHPNKIHDLVGQMAECRQALIENRKPREVEETPVSEEIQLYANLTAIALSSGLRLIETVASRAFKALQDAINEGRELTGRERQVLKEVFGYYLGHLTEGTPLYGLCRDSCRVLLD